MSTPKVAHWKRIAANTKTNLTPEQQDKLTQILSWHGRTKLFSISVMCDLHMTECGTFVRPEDGTLQGRIVYEAMVTQEMCDAHGKLHVGCASLMIDNCSSIALIIKGLVENDSSAFETVSLSLSTTHYSDVPLGDNIRIVNFSTASGTRAVTARAELWNATTGRLAVTANHIKMAPSKPQMKL